MSHPRLFGLGGVLIGLVCLVLGLWAFTYACNTETAACKGLVPWPRPEGFIWLAGWVLGVIGLIIIIIAIVGAVIRMARSD